MIAPIVSRVRRKAPAETIRNHSEPASSSGSTQEGDQRELDVEVEQDPDRADQRQARLEQRHDGVGDEAVERLDVVGDARDQHARGAALVEADRQRLQVREDADAQVGERALADPADEVGLQRRSSAHTSSAETRNAITTSTSVFGVVPARCLCRSRLSPAAAARASRRCRPAARRPSRTRAGGRAAPARSSPRRLRPRVPRLARAPSHCGPGPRPTIGLTGRSPPARSGLRVMKTWSGRPFSTISRYSSEASSSCVVVAVGDDAAVVEHDDLIGERDRREAVGDHEGRAPGHRLVERQLDLLLGRGVDRGGRVVEDQHARVGEQRARDRDALALAARERAARARRRACRSPAAGAR